MRIEEGVSCEVGLGIRVIRRASLNRFSRHKALIRMNLSEHMAPCEGILDVVWNVPLWTLG